MAVFLFWAQLLLLGTLMVPAHTEEICKHISNATKGNFTVQVTPGPYRENTTYLVTIMDGRNHTDNSTRAQKYLLQALSQQNYSVGEWKEVTTENCSVTTAVLDGTQNAANWTSPYSNISSVQIRAYIITNKSVEFRSELLVRAPESTTLPSTTPNSVPMVHSSSFFIALLQMPLLLVTSKLLS